MRGKNSSSFCSLSDQELDEGRDGSSGAQIRRKEKKITDGKNYEWPVNWVGRVRGWGGREGRMEKGEKGKGKRERGPHGWVQFSKIPAGRQEEPYTCTIHHERTRNWKAGWRGKQLFFFTFLVFIWALWLVRPWHFNITLNIGWTPMDGWIGGWANMQMDGRRADHREKDKKVQGSRCMVTTREKRGIVFRRDGIALIPSLCYSLNCTPPPCNAMEHPYPI